MLTTPLSRRSSSHTNISCTCSLDSGSIGFGVNMMISPAEVDHHVPSASPFKRQTRTDRVGGEDGERGVDEAGSSARVAGASEKRESQMKGAKATTMSG